jgi:hypothetical protein
MTCKGNQATQLYISASTGIIVSLPKDSHVDLVNSIWSSLSWEVSLFGNSGKIRTLGAFTMKPGHYPRLLVTSGMVSKTMAASPGATPAWRLPATTTIELTNSKVLIQNGVATKFFALGIIWQLDEFPIPTAPKAVWLPSSRGM